ncbi:MAG: ABC transporter ATP-binding protein [Chitinophagaceae bacterium]
MSKPVIEVENLGKKFVIDHQKKERYTALRDVIVQNIKGTISGSKKFLTGNFKDTNSTKEEFWALKDLNFTINEGDRVGIIGRNGAGKSTLLKLLSRIVEPTTGRITIRGRIASLLEVGTGFHPELTGRENIFLNGAILGMSRAEIKEKFDEIVDFAEVEKFLDTPVKRYSSGMYVRLAFSVAAHLEPEILVVDEVLAVGDARFQKKCLGKLEDISKTNGRTVLFVSHNMAAITALCNTSILLNKGVLEKNGDAREVMNHYLLGDIGSNAVKKWNDNYPGTSDVKLHSIAVVDKSGKIKESFFIDEEVGIRMEYTVLEDKVILWQGHNIYNSEGTNVFDTHDVSSPYYNMPHPKGNYSSIVWIPSNLLAEGTYIVSSAIFNHIQHRIHFHEKDAIIFTIIERYNGKTARGVSSEQFPGIIRPLLNWEINNRS